MASDTNTVINTLRGISDYDTLAVAIETLESVVYNFENPDCSCDYLRDSADAEVEAYAKGARKLIKALRLMADWEDFDIQQ